MTMDVVLHWLNGLGLPLLVIGLRILYKSMNERIGYLDKSMTILQTAHAGAVESMKLQVDSLATNIKSIRELQLEYAAFADYARSDADKFRQTARRLMVDEIEFAQRRAAEAEEAEQHLKTELGKLKSDYGKAVKTVNKLLRENHAYEVQLGKSGPTIRGLA